MLLLFRSLLSAKARRVFGTAAGLLLAGASASAQTDNVYHAFATSRGDAALPQAGLVAGGSILYGATSAGGQANAGALYQINADGTGYAVLHSFGLRAGDAAHPASELALVGGVLYGTTDAGGAHSLGTIYSIHTDGSGYQVLYSFGASATDGFVPHTGLAAANGVLFGTTSAGGNQGGGTLYTIQLDGMGYTIVHHFGATARDATDPAGTLLLSGSILYGVAAHGGANSQGALFSIGTNQAGYQLLHSFGADAGDGKQPLASLIVQGSTLYGTTTLGGANQRGSIFSFDTGAAAYAVIYSFTGGVDAAYPAGSLAVVGAVFYGASQSGGATGAGALFSIAPNGSGYQTLYSFTGSSGDGAVPLGALTALGSTVFGIATYGGAGSDPGGDGVVFSYLDLSGPPPVATTAAATAIAPTSAILNGSVNPNGFFTTAWFEYGPTMTYGTKTPPANLGLGTAVLPIPYPLTGLKLHQLYHYRAVALNANGLTPGADATFTADSAPTATDKFFLSNNPGAQKFSVLPGATDADRDRLSLTATTPGAHGATANSHNQVLYTPGASFTGFDSFGYTIGDGFGGQATGQVIVCTPNFDGPVLFAAGGAAGYLRVTLTRTLALSGQIEVNGSAAGFHGKFVNNVCSITAQGPHGLVAAFVLLLDLPHGQITSFIFTGLSQLGATLANAVSVAGARAQKYTAIMPPPADTALPQGTGYGVMNITPGGAITVAGQAGDGAAFSTGAFLHADGTWCFHTPLPYSAPAPGFLVGNVTFAAAAASDCTGSLAWKRPAQSGGTFYAGGFNTTVNFQAAAYTPPAPGSRVAPFTAGSANFSANAAGLGAPILHLLSISTGNALHVTDPTTDALKLKLMPASGLVTGSLLLPGAPAHSRPAPLGGVIYQKQNPGVRGLMVTPTASGALGIVP